MNSKPNLARAIPHMTISNGNMISQLMPNRSFEFYLNLFFKFALKCFRSIEDVSYTISTSLCISLSSVWTLIGSGVTLLLFGFDL